MPLIIFGDSGTREATREVLGAWLERAQDWYNLSEAALEEGETFDEPPPWDDESTSDH